MVDAEEYMEDDLGISDDEGGDEEPSEDLEDEVMDLKAQLADLQAEFEKLQSGEEGDMEDEMSPKLRIWKSLETSQKWKRLSKKFMTT